MSIVTVTYREKARSDAHAFRLGLVCPRCGSDFVLDRLGSQTLAIEVAGPTCDGCSPPPAARAQGGHSDLPCAHVADVAKVWWASGRGPVLEWRCIDDAIGAEVPAAGKEQAGRIDVPLGADVRRAITHGLAEAMGLPEWIDIWSPGYCGLLDLIGAGLGVPFSRIGAFRLVLLLAGLPPGVSDLVAAILIRVMAVHPDRPLATAVDALDLVGALGCVSNGEPHRCATLARVAPGPGPLDAEVLMGRLHTAMSGARSGQPRGLPSGPYVFGGKGQDGA